MAHGLSSVTKDDVPRIVLAEALAVPKAYKAVLWLLVVIGLGVFARGALSKDPQLYWVSFYVNVFFWMLIAAASTCFASVILLCNAQWARPITRIFEASSQYLALSILLVGLLYIGHQHVLPWAPGPVAGRGPWLIADFLFIRDIAALTLLTLLAYKVVYHGIRKDILAIRGGLTGVEPGKLSRWFDKSLDHYVHGANINKARQEIQKSNHIMWRLGPVVILTYALVISFLAFDLLMSVDPHWFSTLFGAFIFMSGIYLAVTVCAIMLGFVREMSPLIRSKIERRTLHDLGKLVFGFGIFWAYLFWSHYLTIWYGNMPEETAWVILRLRKEPWHSLAWLIFGSCFIIPFMLGLSRDVKQVPQLLFATGVIVVCGIWLQMYLMVAPTLYPNQIPLGLKDVAISLGFLGMFMLSHLSFLERHPLIPFGDFYQVDDKAAPGADALKHAA